MDIIIAVNPVQFQGGIIILSAAYITFYHFSIKLDYTAARNARQMTPYGRFDYGKYIGIAYP
jgi:hypothetical protein